MTQQHNWDLRGGARGEASEPSIPTGYAFFQCKRCGITAARQITARNTRSVSSVIPKPEIDEECVQTARKLSGEKIDLGEE